MSCMHIIEYFTSVTTSSITFRPVRWVFVQCNNLPNRPVSGGVADVVYVNIQIGWGGASSLSPPSPLVPLVAICPLSPALRLVLCVFKSPPCIQVKAELGLKSHITSSVLLNVRPPSTIFWSSTGLLVFFYLCIWSNAPVQCSSNST